MGAGIAGLASAGNRVGPRHLGEQLLVVMAVPRLVELELLVEFLLLDVGQDRTRQLKSGLPFLSHTAAGGMLPPLSSLYLCMARAICLRLLAEFCAAAAAIVFSFAAR